MTFEELPKYCAEHTCWRNLPQNKCEHISLCTRFFKKYRHLPSVFKRSGVPADKFKVSVDLSWNIKCYKEYYIAAKTASKATYRVAKMMSSGGVKFGDFVKYCRPCAERIPFDSEIDYYLEYTETECGSDKYTCKRVKL